MVFGQNQIYVLETLRAEGTSAWYTCAHDEFALVMDGDVEIHLVKFEGEQVIPAAEHAGAVLEKGAPKGPKMGWMKLEARLPGAAAGLNISAYRFKAAKPAVVVRDLQGRSVDRALGRDLPDGLNPAPHPRRSA